MLVSSAREGAKDFINIVPRIALGVVGSGYIAAVIPPEVITGWFGPDSGWFGIIIAYFIVPWRYVWARYFAQPMEPLRQKA